MKVARRRLVVTLLLGAIGCSGGDTGAEEAVEADTLTRRQRDSLIGESPLPGAAGVRGALRAADSAAARLRRLDSIGEN